MAYENIIAETIGRAGLVTLNRPKALNALNSALIVAMSAPVSSTPSHRTVEKPGKVKVTV